eukprot:g3774.t1
MIFLAGGGGPARPPSELLLCSFTGESLSPSESSTIGEYTFLARCRFICSDVGAGVVIGREAVDSVEADSGKIASGAAAEVIPFSFTGTTSAGELGLANPTSPSRGETDAEDNTPLRKNRPSLKDALISCWCSPSEKAPADPAANAQSATLSTTTSAGC